MAAETQCFRKFGRDGSSPRLRGMSFAEVMIVLGVLVVVISVIVPSVTNVVPSVKESTAEANLEQLNKAVLKFGQANWELTLPVASDASDELAIFRSLQYRAASNPSPGSPYLEPRLAFVETDDSTVCRAQWNGRMFQMISPGSTGTGLDLSRMAEGTEPTAFAEGYQPVGAR